MDQFNQLFTPPQSPVHNPNVWAAILRDIRTMDYEIEAERMRCIWAELFMNQATGNQQDQQNQGWSTTSTTTCYTTTNLHK